MRQGRGIAVAVTVAVAAGLGSVDAALAQIQLVPQGRPSSAAPPSQQQRPPAFRPTNRPEASGPTDQRGPRRRGQAQQPATDAARADPNAPSNFPRRLDQRTIRTRFFNGQPINARALGGGLFTLVFHEDGRMERTAANGQVTTGRWRFVGDSYCSRWDSTAQPTTQATAPAPATPRQRGQRAQPQPAQRTTPETCHTVVEEGTTIRVVRNTRAVATWAREGTPPPP